MSQTLLIVDDSPLMRKVLKKAISMAELTFETVLEAGDGRTALELLAKNKVTLALVDINMPEMNGIELVERMSRAGFLRVTDVVMVSTERNEARVERLTSLGVKGYLTKPFRPEELLRIVKSSSGNRSAGGGS